MNNDKDKYNKYFEILELSENASLADIKSTYEKLKRLYSSKSMATHPLEDEFGDEEKQEIVKEIEEAYEILIRYVVEKDRIEKESAKVNTGKKDKLEDTVVEMDFPGTPEATEAVALRAPLAPIELTDPVAPAEPAETVAFTKPIEPVEPIETAEPAEPVETTEPVESVEPVETAEPAEPVETADTIKITEPVEPDDTVKFTESVEPEKVAEELLKRIGVKGRALKKVREKLGIGIHEIAVSTKISYKTLVNIELERYEKLPEPGYLRWHVMTYAKALYLDPKKTAEEYMKRYRRWERKKEESEEDS